MQFNGNLVVAPDRQRAIYEGLRRKAPGNIITPSFIRLEKPLVSGKGVYSFDIQKNVGNAEATEVRLDINDAFMATHLGIYLLKKNADHPGLGALETYPSPVTFPAENNNVDPSHLEELYNGFLRVKVGDVVFAETIPTRDFRVVRTQQAAAAVAAGVDTDTPVYPAAPQQLSESHGYDGLQELTPQFTFQGQSKNQLELHVPTNSNQEVQYKTATDRIYVVWYMKGFLVTQGSALGSQLR